MTPKVNTSRDMRGPRGVGMGLVEWPNPSCNPVVSDFSDSLCLIVADARCSDEIMTIVAMLWHSVGLSF